MSDEVHTLFKSRSLFTLKTESSTLATESLPRTCFPGLENEPKFNNVGTVLATECWLPVAAGC